MSEEPKKEQGQTEKQYPVKRVCSWCEKDMGLADFMSNEPGQITHGICSECLEKISKEEEKKEE